MKAKRRIEITVETHERTVIHLRQNQAMIFCKYCETNTLHLSTAQAALILPFSEPAISRMADDKKIHSTQDDGGTLLLCSKSLAALEHP